MPRKILSDEYVLGKARLYRPYPFGIAIPHYQEAPKKDDKKKTPSIIKRQKYKRTQQIPESPFVEAMNGAPALAMNTVVRRIATQLEEQIQRDPKDERIMELQKEVQYQKQMRQLESRVLVERESDVLGELEDIQLKQELTKSSQKAVRGMDETAMDITYEEMYTMFKDEDPELINPIRFQKIRTKREKFMYLLEIFGNDVEMLKERIQETEAFYKEEETVVDKVVKMLETDDLSREFVEQWASLGWTTDDLDEWMKSGDYETVDDAVYAMVESQG